MRILDRKLLLDLLTALATSLALTTSAFLFGYFYAHSRWLEGVRPGVLLSWLLHYLPTSAAQGKGRSSRGGGSTASAWTACPMPSGTPPAPRKEPSPPTAKGEAWW